MTKLRPNRRRRGFTLIEVMVVLVLVAVLSGVMIAEMAGTFEDALLRSTGREVISICALASSRSITLLQPHTVVIDPRENRYAIERPQLEKENRSGSRTLRDTHGGEGQFDPRIQIDIRNPRRAGTEEENASRGQSPPAPRGAARRDHILPGRNRGRTGDPAARPNRGGTHPPGEPSHIESPRGGT